MKIIEHFEHIIGTKLSAQERSLIKLFLENELEAILVRSTNIYCSSMNGHNFFDEKYIMSYKMVTLFSEKLKSIGSDLVIEVDNLSKLETLETNEAIKNIMESL